MAVMKPLVASAVLTEAVEAVVVASPETRSMAARKVLVFGVLRSWIGCGAQRSISRLVRPWRCARCPFPAGAD